MKIFKVSLTIVVLLGMLFILQACDNNDDSDLNYLYLPNKIKIGNSDVTSYTYDSQNRIVKIEYNGSSNRSIISNIKYTSSTNNPELYTSNIYLVNGIDSILSYTLYREIRYNGKIITIHSERSDGVNTPTYTIELDENGNIAKRTNMTTNSYVMYEVDKNKNITKTINNDSSTIINYKYDDKRGVFREVNMPSWFIQGVMSIEIDSVQINGNCIYDVKNNLISSITTQKTDTTNNVLNKSYDNIYGGFWYPTRIDIKENKSNIKEVTQITYTAVNKD